MQSENILEQKSKATLYSKVVLKRNKFKKEKYMRKLSVKTRDYFRIRDNCKANKISGIVIKKKSLDNLFCSIAYGEEVINLHNTTIGLEITAKIKHIHLVDPKKYDSKLDEHYSDGFFSFSKRCNVQELLKVYGYNKNDVLVLLEVE